MAERKHQSEVVPSLFERLTDLEPAKREEAPLTYVQSVRRLRVTLRRDLEWLLNTRQPLVDVPDWCKELPYSLIRYGLPDLTTYSMGTKRDQARLIDMLERTLQTFEPRLSNVVVNLLPVNTKARVLKFQIEGNLRMENGVERVQFDTTLDLSSGTYNVGGENGA